MTYDAAVFFMAQCIKKDLVSFERLLLVGSLGCFVGLVLQAPEHFIKDCEMAFFPEIPDWLKWTTQMTAIVLSSIGTAGLYMPSLPLMQTEATHLGEQAVEQISSTWISTMTVAEGLGPIVGGWLTGKVGFTQATFLSMFGVAPLVVATIATYDADVIRDRIVSKKLEPEALSKPLMSGDGPAKAKTFDNPLHIPFDGDAAFRRRFISQRILFDEKDEAPGSAPSITFRRPFSSAPSRDPTASKSWSMPSTGWRKPLQPNKLESLRTQQV